MSAGIDYSERIAPESWMPSQYADAHRHQEFVEEKRLWAAVFEEAVKQYRRSLNSELRLWHYAGPGNRQKRLEELEQWFADPGTYPGSFLFVCEALDLDSDATLRHIFEPKRRVCQYEQHTESLIQGRDGKWRCPQCHRTANRWHMKRVRLIETGGMDHRGEARRRREASRVP